MAGMRKPKSTEPIGRIPQARHDSRGVANSWKLSTFVANTAGRCAVCGEPFPIGTNVQMWRDTKKRVHPRCADGVARSTGKSNLEPSVKEKVGVDLAKPRPTNRGRVTKRSGAGDDTIDFSADDRLLVSAKDLPFDIRLIIGNTSCPICEVRTGTPCKALGTQTVHKYRATIYGRSQGSSPYRDIQRSRDETIDLSVNDRLFISAKDLRIDIRLIIDNTSCAVCDVGTGAPCKGAPTGTMHKYRATTYGRSQGSSPYRDIQRWVL